MKRRFKKIFVVSIIFCSIIVFNRVGLKADRPPGPSANIKIPLIISEIASIK